MKSRERFLETMRFGKPERVPYFEEGIRKEVLRAWRKQGLAAQADLAKMFATDGREEIRLDVDPHPWPEKWPKTRVELEDYVRRLDPDDPARTPEGWKKNIKLWKSRDHVLMMRLHMGFFETLGVEGWARLHELIVLMHDDPGFVREMMRINGEFVARLTERLL
jgi:hypothetical protein